MSRTSLECPCCGGPAAVPDREGFYYDMQRLYCGCVGHVVTDDHPDGPNVWIESECEDEIECPVSGAPTVEWPWPAVWDPRSKLYVEP